MREQYFVEHTDPEDIADESGQEEDALLEKSDLPGAQDRILAAFVRELPAGSVPTPDVTRVDTSEASEASPLAAAQVSPDALKMGSQPTLLDAELSRLLRLRWKEIQGTFVDEPHSAVQQADALVAEVVEKITSLFSNERDLLERQWKQGKTVSTEELRQTLQHYRSFFNRLVV